jgi:hypothetical protein
MGQKLKSAWYFLGAPPQKEVSGFRHSLFWLGTGSPSKRAQTKALSLAQAK